MAKKKETPKPKKPSMDAWFENAGITQEEPITDTLEKNYLPYAMSVIISRALPEIDGFKPSHRKLLYTMYKMNLIKGHWGLHSVHIGSRESSLHRRRSSGFREQSSL